MEEMWPGWFHAKHGERAAAGFPRWDTAPAGQHQPVAVRSSHSWARAMCGIVSVPVRTTRK